MFLRYFLCDGCHGSPHFQRRGSVSLKPNYIFIQGRSTAQLSTLPLHRALHSGLIVPSTLLQRFLQGVGWNPEPQAAKWFCNPCWVAAQELKLSIALKPYSYTKYPQYDLKFLNCNPACRDFPLSFFDGVSEATRIGELFVSVFCGKPCHHFILANAFIRAFGTSLRPHRFGTSAYG